MTEEIPMLDNATDRSTKQAPMRETTTCPVCGEEAEYEAFYSKWAIPEGVSACIRPQPAVAGVAVFYHY